MPMPRRSAADVLGVFLGGALSVFIPDGAAFAEPLPASLQVSVPSLLAATANAKEKVAKPPPAPPSKSKPDPSTGDHREDEDEGGSGFFHFLGAILQSPTPPPAATPATAFASEASRWSVGSEAWIVAPAEMDSVALWEAPGDPAHPDTLEVGALPHGTHVVVVETHAMASGFWTRVRPFEGVEPNGWIPSWILSKAPAPRPGAPSPPEPDPRWGLRLLFAYGGLGPADLDVEYSKGGVRLEAQYLRLMNDQWISGFGLGYREIYGDPQQAYQSGTTLEDPHDSRFQTYEIGMRAGQRYGDRSGFRFDWMLGPTLAYVHENTNLLVYTVVPPSTLVLVGPAGDRLGRWAGGGEFRANFGWMLPGAEWSPEVGLQLSAFMFAWEGHEQHSLATDFVHSNIHGWDIGLSVTFY